MWNRRDDYEYCGVCKHRFDHPAADKTRQEERESKENECGVSEEGHTITREEWPNDIICYNKKIITQYEISPERIVAIIFFEK